MKFIILLFALLIVTKERAEDYTINTFIVYLQEQGYYDIIKEIKCHYGADVAINFCLELVSSPHCEEVVRVYIPICYYYSPAAPPPSPDFETIREITKEYRNINMEKLERLVKKCEFKEEMKYKKINDDQFIIKKHF